MKLLHLLFLSLIALACSVSLRAETTILGNDFPNELDTYTITTSSFEAYALDASTLGVKAEWMIRNISPEQTAVYIGTFTYDTDNIEISTRILYHIGLTPLLPADGFYGPIPFRGQLFGISSSTILGKVKVQLYRKR